jgi:hypothetical protein
VSRKLRIVTAAALSLCAPFLAGSVGMTTNLNERLLASHNRERSSAGVPRLEWSPALEASARTYALYLARTGRFEHSHDVTGVEVQGENLWAGTRDYYGPEAMVGLWVAEKKTFKPGVFPDNSRTGDVEAVGHYTQLMWRQTRQVGCSLTKGREEDVLVCRYSEAGNVPGETPF